MSSSQIAAPYRRSPHPVVAGVVAAAFALGALTGFGLPRLLDGTRHATGVTGPIVAAQTFKGVADNNMSDAARRASYGNAVQAPSFAGVADNNMSDAARRAIYGSEAGEH